MKTELININKDYNIAIISAIAELEKGNIIGFPTETVYGVGCGIFNKNAVYDVFNLKARSEKKPLSAHIGSLSDVERLCRNIPDSFYILAERFLPGPLAIILEKKEIVPDIVTSGLPTLSIRFPDHRFLTDTIKEFGSPIAGTSANISGQPFTINGDMVYHYFDGKIGMILDDGDTKLMKESTVITLVGDRPRCFREAAIKIEQLEELLSVKFL